MQYQAIKHNKTGSRVLGIFPSIGEARAAIRGAAPTATRQGDSYVGGFPYYMDVSKDGTRPYTIQGLARPGIVCSIPSEEKTKLTD